MIGSLLAVMLVRCLADLPPPKCAWAMDRRHRHRPALHPGSDRASAGAQRDHRFRRRGHHAFQRTGDRLHAPQRRGPRHRVLRQHARRRQRDGQPRARAVLSRVAAAQSLRLLLVVLLVPAAFQYLLGGGQPGPHQAAPVDWRWLALLFPAGALVALGWRSCANPIPGCSARCCWRPASASASTCISACRPVPAALANG